MKYTARIALLAALLSPGLYAQEVMSLEPGPNGESIFTFDAIDGSTYFWQVSDDLGTTNPWLFAPDVIAGNNMNVERCVMPESPTDKLFGRYIRIPVEPENVETADFDLDGFSNIQELEILNTSPLALDTNGDNIADGAGDLDGDGVADGWEEVAAAASDTDEWESPADINADNAYMVSMATNAGPARFLGADNEPTNIGYITATRRVTGSGDFSRQFGFSTEEIRETQSFNNFDNISIRLQEIYPFPEDPPLSNGITPLQSAVESGGIIRKGIRFQIPSNADITHHRVWLFSDRPTTKYFARVVRREFEGTSLRLSESNVVSLTVSSGKTISDNYIDLFIADTPRQIGDPETRFGEVKPIEININNTPERDDDILEFIPGATSNPSIPITVTSSDQAITGIRLSLGSKEVGGADFPNPAPLTFTERFHTYNLTNPGTSFTTDLSINPQFPVADGDTLIVRVQIGGANDGASPVIEKEVKVKLPGNLTPDLATAGVVGNLVGSAIENSQIRHFVTPKKSTELPQDFVVLEATGITVDQITPGNANQLLEWDATEGEVVPDEPLKWRIARDQVKKAEVKLRLAGGGAISEQINVWVVWADSSLEFQGATSVMPTPSQQAGIFITNVQVNVLHKHSIKPLTIITDPERPALSGARTFNPPGGNHPLFQTPLRGGVNNKWDASRRFRYKNENPNNLTAGNFAPPAPLITVLDFPTNPVEGNDDSDTGDEVPFAGNSSLPNETPNNPYRAENLGDIWSFDQPSLSIAAGALNSKFKFHLQLQEFLRLQIGNKWFRVSNYVPWRAEWNLRKETQQGVELWLPDSSIVNPAERLEVESNHDDF